MFCSNCGAKLPDDAQFCPECGKKMINVSSDGSNESSGAAPITDTLVLEQEDVASEAEFDVDYPSPVKIKIYYLGACLASLVCMIGSIADWLDLESSSGHHYGTGRVKLFSSIFDFCVNVPGWIPALICSVFFALLAFEFRKYLLQFDLSKQLKIAVQALLGVAVAAVVWDLVTETMEDFFAIKVGYAIIFAVWIGIGQALRKSEITPLGTWFLAAGIAWWLFCICAMFYGLMYYIDSDTESLSMLAAVLVMAATVCECKVFMEMGKYLGADDDDDTEE